METFGKYEILEKIGEGGFGVIYKGYDPLIKRTVAIKTCTSEDEEIRHRFFQEAEIAGNLHHRNITIVYDFGVEREVPYLVQEYLGGEDLDRKIKRRDPMSFGTKLLYLVQTARGLEYAHSRGIIHRDIKPSNIRVLDDDAVKIMDFGIAKLAHSGKTSLTQTGQTIGTAAYLAPEQIRGESIDQRADIFAFGVLTYELLTGHRAFGGDNPSSVIYKVLTEEPRSITDFVPDCPSVMQAIVRRCLEKHPEDRYLNCSALLADLDLLLENKRTDSGKVSTGEATRLTAETIASDRPLSGPLETSSSSPHSTLQVPPQSSIDHVRLRADGGGHPHSAPLITGGAAQARGRGIFGYLLLFSIMALLGAGAWWYWERYLPEHEGESLLTALQSLLPASADAGGVQAAEQPTSEEATAASAEPVATPSSSAVEPAEESSGSEIATAPETVAEAEPPPPPPPPPRATLVLPEAWDPNMTVSISGARALRLDRERRVQLPPGSYTLAFDLIGRDYDATAELDVRLREGQTREVRLPIPRPARIQVRQLPGSPRGWVLANDEPLGWSPLQEKQMAPGKYTLTVKRGPNESEVDVSYPVTLRSDRLLIVTFDLRRSGPPTLVERPVRR